MNTNKDLIKAKHSADDQLKAIAENAPAWIVNIDLNGNIQYINHVLPQYKLEDVLGTSVFLYIQPEGVDIYKKNINEVIETGEKRIFYIESKGLDIGTVYYEAHMAPIRTGDQITGLVLISLDVSEKIRAQMRLEQALAEKEALLKEVHHRSKNNLQLISSILNIQSYKALDSASYEIIKDCKSSIRSLALLHELLYKSEDFSELRLDEYITNLCDYFTGINKESCDVSMELDLDNYICDMDRSIICGLIINELLTNSFKHAFKDDTGEIKLSLKKHPRFVELRISDNGTGYEQTDSTTPTTGLELVRGLVQQLDGTLEEDTSSGNGSHYSIRF